MDLLLAALLRKALLRSLRRHLIVYVRIVLLLDHELVIALVRARFVHIVGRDLWAH